MTDDESSDRDATPEAPPGKRFSWGRVIAAVLGIVIVAGGGWGATVLTRNAAARNGAESVFRAIERLKQENPNGYVLRSRVYEYVRRVPTLSGPVGPGMVEEEYVFHGWSKIYRVRVKYLDYELFTAELWTERKL
jgi:hypothetical protein